ncbi:flavodoxin family protein [Limnobacter litoralis]|uniref:Flavodoxin n=1 Tax=Limnobacter litoralis TaxID=481366 RepID=A0ABQ5YQM0_9BURK|nr:NAD(P)H-dependent oxidoreductase [Limnobacter litoralis]GLR26915.1 flavodoxin [Limnobacter litoralis]
MIKIAPPHMKTLLIVYHSMTGGTAQMAQAALEGARTETEIQTTLLHADNADAQAVLKADGYLFMTPENLAAVSGRMKDFFDRSYYGVLGRINGRPFAVAVCAGSDGSNAVRQIQRIATGWRLNEVAPPLIVCTHAQSTEVILQAKQITDADLQRCRELGEALACGLAAGVF